MADVVLRDIHKRYENATDETIKGIDLTIADGEFAVLVGPSGCGKSTLLRMIAGLEDITSGELEIGGRRCNEVSPSERGIAMVFQNYALYPHMSLFDNMAFALKLAKTDKREIEKKVVQAAEILKIEKDLRTTKPGDLSGGQRQRVAIGRAIVREPAVFLFDEPLSNLDAGLRVEMRIQIARLHTRLATTSVYVTHDQVEAMTLADKIVVLDRGLVAHAGPPLDLYLRPANRFVAEFIGSPKMNILSAKILDADPNGARVQLQDGTVLAARVDASRAASGATVSLGLRPEHLSIHRESSIDGATLAGVTALVEHLGEQTLVYVETEATDELVVVRESGIASARAGESVRVNVPASACYLFDDADVSFPRIIHGDGV